MEWARLRQGESGGNGVPQRGVSPGLGSQVQGAGVPADSWTGTGTCSLSCLEVPSWAWAAGERKRSPRAAWAAGPPCWAEFLREGGGGEG